jgi:hypothetical protein
MPDRVPTTGPRRPLRRRPAAILCLALLALSPLLAGCGATEEGPQVVLVTATGGPQVMYVTATPGVPATALPTGIAPSPPPAGAAVRTVETFDDNRNGWFETHEAPVWEVWIEGGEYHLVIQAIWEGPAHIARPWEHPGEPLAGQYGDVTLEVRVRAAGDPNGYGGLALAIDEAYTSYYLFVVYPDGSWGVEKRVAGESELLSDPNASSRVHPAPGTNVLKLVRAGSQLTFFANGVQLGSVTDASLSAGYVGVVAGDWDEPVGAHWAFDDFQVEAPQ